MKLAVLPPAAMVTLGTCVVPVKNSPWCELDARLTARPPVPATTGLPKASSNCTVIEPEDPPAVKLCAEVVKASLAAAAGLTVSGCETEFELRPVVVAVIVGAPAAVSSYVKLAVLPLTRIETLVTCVVPVKNSPAAEVLVSAMVCLLVAMAALPYWSSNCTLIVADFTPAVSVCGVVPNAREWGLPARTVSCCVVELRPVAEAVSVGESAWVSS